MDEECVPGAGTKDCLDNLTLYVFVIRALNAPELARENRSGEIFSDRLAGTASHTDEGDAAEPRSVELG